MLAGPPHCFTHGGSNHSLLPEHWVLITTTDRHTSRGMGKNTRGLSPRPFPLPQGSDAPSFSQQTG